MICLDEDSFDEDSMFYEEDEGQNKFGPSECDRCIICIKRKRDELEEEDEVEDQEQDDALSCRDLKIC